MRVGVIDAGHVGLVRAAALASLERDVAAGNAVVEAVLVVVGRLRDELGDLEGARIALLGLSSMPQTDHVRLSPALALAELLLDAGADVVGFDPRAGANAKAVVPQLRIAADPYDAAGGANAIVLATAWPELHELEWASLREAVASPVFLDARNVIDGASVVGGGFAYVSAGRPPLRLEA